MIGIVGYGHVGKAMKELFRDAIIYDKYIEMDMKEDINRCEVVFVCVPTPMLEDGLCDTSDVDDVLEWVDADVIVIRSTVPIGYTRTMREKLRKHIVFQPEYYGETVNHPLADLRKRDWIILGGDIEDTSKVLEVYQKVYTAEVKIAKIDSDTAEMAKYMENAFYATKVTFCNEMYDIATAYNIDYDLLREIWLMDPRINRSHTFVYKDNRGYGGSCLPKDICSLKYMAEKKGINADLIKSVIEKNDKYQI